ncbi:protein of unknown function [Burkholderia multivorans]
MSGVARNRYVGLRTFVTHGAVARSGIGSNRVAEGHFADCTFGREAEGDTYSAEFGREGETRCAVDTASQPDTAEPQAPPSGSGCGQPLGPDTR